MKKHFAIFALILVAALSTTVHAQSKGSSYETDRVPASLDEQKRIYLKIIAKLKPAPVTLKGSYSTYLATNSNPRFAETQSGNAYCEIDAFPMEQWKNPPYAIGISCTSEGTEKRIDGAITANDFEMKESNGVIEIKAVRGLGTKVIKLFVDAQTLEPLSAVIRTGYTVSHDRFGNLMNGNKAQIFEFRASVQ